mmetsp:Transcript_9921/g.23637  ORF Transcript_9921/g.23637 Transcript_9921/m.23637 type:complete len:249 (-) Transcript_9921:392-1138(-)
MLFLGLLRSKILLPRRVVLLGPQLLLDALQLLGLRRGSSDPLKANGVSVVSQILLLSLPVAGLLHLLELLLLLPSPLADVRLLVLRHTVLHFPLLTLQPPLQLGLHSLHSTDCLLRFHQGPLVLCHLHHRSGPAGCQASRAHGHSIHRCCRPRLGAARRQHSLCVLTQRAWRLWNRSPRRPSCIHAALGRANRVTAVSTTSRGWGRLRHVCPRWARPCCCPARTSSVHHPTTHWWRLWSHTRPLHTAW